jgi:hypothetical protein
MAVKKSKISLLEKTLITIVRFGLNVKATLSTRGNLTQRRRKRQERKAEKKAVDRKRRSSLDKVKLKFEALPSELKIKENIRRVKREKKSKNTK